MADSEDIVVTGSPIKREPDELTLVVDGKEYRGWQEVEVTLRAEGFPNSFSIALSNGSASPVPFVQAKAGNACTILLGNDKVITGYIDRDVVSESAIGHALQILGRGLTQDLVDCAGEWPDGQMIDGDALSIATNLALPYGIAVELGKGAEAGGKVPTWALNYGETGAAVIQRLAQNAGLLAYEDSAGKLILGAVGSTTAASGVVRGKNVEDWSIENSMDGRFSEIICSSFPVASLSDLQGSDFFDTEKDENVRRHRRMVMVAETVADKVEEFTIKKAKWEVARRAGRSYVVRATVDSWRDSAGTLWAPNTLVPVDLPGLQGDKTLCVSEVTFRRNNESGTTAALVLMTPKAFTPEPIVLQPVNTADLAGAPGQ